MGFNGATLAREPVDETLASLAGSALQETTFRCREYAEIDATDPLMGRGRSPRLLEKRLYARLGPAQN